MTDGGDRSIGIAFEGAIDTSGTLTGEGDDSTTCTAVDYEMALEATK